jgi:hypothetical protein
MVSLAFRAPLRYGNGGDLSFMLIIGIALREFVMISFVSGQIYTNSKAGEKYKSAAQGLITLATYGVGMVGFAVAGWITDYKMLDGTTNWQMVYFLQVSHSYFFYYLHSYLIRKKKRNSSYLIR